MIHFLQNWIIWTIIGLITQRYPLTDHNFFKKVTGFFTNLIYINEDQPGDFFVGYSSLDSILISGFDLGWYFAEQSLNRRGEMGLPRKCSPKCVQDEKNGGGHVLPLTKPEKLALQCFQDFCSGRANSWAKISLQRLKYYRTIIPSFARSFMYNNCFNKIYLRQYTRKISTIVLLEKSPAGRFFRAGDPGSISNFQKRKRRTQKHQGNLTQNSTDVTRPVLIIVNKISVKYYISAGKF